MNFLPIIGTIVKKILDVIDKAVPDKDLREKLKAEIQLTIFTKEYDVIIKQLEAQKEIIVAEATGHSWLQRNWRPIAMLVFVYIVAHNYIFAPLFGLSYLQIPPDMWDLLKIGIGGYVVGRSAEKIIPQILNKKGDK